jgi:hypothetical protein
MRSLFALDSAIDTITDRTKFTFTFGSGKVSVIIYSFLVLVIVAWVFSDKNNKNNKKNKKIDNSKGIDNSSNNSNKNNMSRTISSMYGGGGANHKNNSNSNSSQSSSSSSSSSKDMELIINAAKDLIHQGKTNDAFAVLLHAIKLTRGEDAILEVLDSVKQRHEIDLLSKDVDAVNLREVYKVMDELMEADTLLKEQGCENILTEAFEDGSSVVCRNCGGLIAKTRWSDHVMYWCDAAGEQDEDNFEMVLEDT